MLWGGSFPLLPPPPPPIDRTLIISISYYYQCYRHYNHLNKQPWYGLWWIILLQYTHLAQTAMSILHCPRLPDRGGNIAPVSRYLLVRHIHVSSGIESFERFKLSQFYQQTVYIRNNKPCIFKTFILEHAYCTC